MERFPVPGHDTVRIRRFSDGGEFRASLETEAPDVLPIWFVDEERDWIARTVGPKLAELAPGCDHTLETSAIRHSPDDWVLAPPSGPEMLLARRYAVVTGRPLALTDGSSLAPVFGGGAPRSLTWFCPLDECDIASRLFLLCRTLSAALGKLPPLGVLTAESTAKLSWLLAKQVMPHPDERIGVTTLVSMESTAPRSSLVHVGSARTVADVVAGMNGATGTLLINAHSRPHCGILKVADGELGICGWTSGAADGLCVDGTACYFGEAPRAVLQDLQAPRIFFNGCTTAGVGCRRLDFLPRPAMVSHAALRGRAKEFVGNVRVGEYDEADLNWFLGASALGYTPAQSVEIVERARTSSGHERMRSTVYFGDATNAAWPVHGVSVGDVVVEDQRVRIRWARPDGVLVARVPGRIVADLAEHDRLHAATQHPSQPRIAVLSDPFQDASLVLVAPCVEGENSSTDVEISFSALVDRVDRSVGRVLAPAVEQVRWLEGLRAFAGVLDGASRQLEEELVALRRAAASRSDVTMLPELLTYVRAREEEAACRFDGVLIDEALCRSQGSWNWQMEYGARVHTAPRSDPSSCPNCGAFANDVDCTDWANPRVVRTVKACGYCGVVADLPVWGLHVRIVRENLVFSATELRGSAEIHNSDDRARRVTVAVAVVRGGPMQPGSTARTELVVGAGETARFAFALTPLRPMREMMHTRVYVASEGAFGLVGANLLYGRSMGGHEGAGGDPQPTEHG